MGETEQLAEFALDPSLDNPPPAVAAMAASCLLDFVGCAAGGAATWMGRAVRELAAEQGGRAEATVVAGGHLKLPAQLCALCNGQQANVLDFDDTYLDLGHTGAVVIPAALAIAERVDATFAQLRGAIVAGYEVANRIGLATRPSDARFRLLYPVGWHAFGAAVAAGRLLGFGRTTMLNTIGIVAEHTQVATTVTTDTIHAFKAGKLGQASALGVLAVSLAARGFEGKQTVLDADRRLALALGSDRFAPELLVADLGDRFSIAEMSFKPYQSCRMTHGALAAAAAIAAAHDFDPDRIAGVTVRTFSRMLQLTEPAPATAEAMPFSLPFALALALRRVPPGPRWSTPETLADPALLRLARLIRVEADPAVDAIVDRTGGLPAAIAIRLDDGRMLHESAADAPWGPDDPPDARSLQAKFLGMAEPCLGSRAREFVSALLDPDSARGLTAREIGRLVA